MGIIFVDGENHYGDANDPKIKLIDELKKHTGESGVDCKIVLVMRSWNLEMAKNELLKRQYKRRYNGK